MAESRKTARNDSRPRAAPRRQVRERAPLLKKQDLENIVKGG